MKKVLSALALIGLVVLIMPVPGFAQPAPPAVPVADAASKCSDFTTEADCSSSCIWNPDTSKCSGVYISSASDIIDIIERIGNWIFAILMAVAGVFLIYAGFLWVTAGGSTENVNKAKSMFTNAIIGMIVALVARGLVTAITKVIGA